MTDLMIIEKLAQLVGEEINGDTILGYSYDGEAIRVKDIQSLDLSDDDINALPENIGCLSNLHRLYAGYTQLTSLPESIGNLRSLKKLDVRGLQITSLPESVWDITSLQYLNVSGTQLNHLPESIGKLINLQSLDVGGTMLTSLPESVGNLINLHSMDISGTQISTLPESMKKLGSLQYLNTKNTKIQHGVDDFNRPSDTQKKESKVQFDFARLDKLYTYGYDVLESKSFNTCYENLSQGINNAPAWADDRFVLEEAYWYGKLLCEESRDFSEVPDALWENGEFTFLCLYQFEDEFPEEQFVRIKEMLSDRELWFHIIKYIDLGHFAGMLEYAPMELVNDREFMMRMIDLEPYCQKYSSFLLRDDKEVVISAAKKYGFSLKYATPRLRNDKEVVLAAIHNCGGSLQHASSELKDNEEFAWQAAKCGCYEDGAIYYASERIRHDKEFLLDCIAIENDNYLIIPDEYRNDRSFIMECVKRCGEKILKLLPEEFQNDREVKALCLSNIREPGLSIAFKAFTDELLKLQPSEYRDEIITYNERLAYFATYPDQIENYPTITHNWELMRLLVSLDGKLLRYASDSLKNDKEIVSCAVENEPSAIIYASGRLQCDSEIVKLAEEKFPTVAYFDIYRDTRFETLKFTPYSAYVADWGSKEVLPGVGDIKTIHISDSFKCRVNDAFYVIWNAANQFDVRLSDESKLIKCKLLGTQDEKKRFIKTGGPYLRVCIMKIWSIQDWLKEDMHSSTVDTPFFSCYDATYDERNGNWSLEGLDCDGAVLRFWNVYTDSNCEDHVFLKQQGYDSGQYRKSLTIGNLLLGDRVVRRTKKLFWKLKTLDGLFEYGISSRGIYLVRYLANDKNEVTIPSDYRTMGCDGYTDDICDFYKKFLSIEEYAFSECESLETVKLPKLQVTVEPYAFYKCKKLRKVFLSRETEVMENAFYGCSEELELIYS